MWRGVLVLGHVIVSFAFMVRRLKWEEGRFACTLFYNTHVLLNKTMTMSLLISTDTCQVQRGISHALQLCI